MEQINVDSESVANDGRVLADALLSVPSTVLASSLVLMREANLISVLFSNFKTRVGLSGNDFQKNIAAKTEELAKQSRGNLALELVLQLNQELDIESQNYVVRRDIDDNMSRIAYKAMEILRNNEKEFKGYRLEELVDYEVQKLITGIGKKLEDLPEKERREVTGRFREVIGSLPADQQAAIKKVLGADELTTEFLQQTLFARSAGTLFIGTLVDLSIGEIFLIPFLTNPLFITIMFCGGSTYLYSRNNRKLRSGLVPMVVRHLVNAGMVSKSADEIDTSTREFLKVWTDGMNQYRSARNKVADLEQQLKNTQDSLENVNKCIATNKIEKKAHNAEKQLSLAHLAEVLKTKASELASGTWHTDLATLGQQIVDDLNKVDEITKGPIREGFFTNILDSGWKGWNESYTQAGIEQAASAVASQVYSLAQNGIEFPDGEVKSAIDKVWQADRTDLLGAGLHFGCLILPVHVP